MHVQIVNFELDGVTEQDYIAMCEQLAPEFAALPGLISKVWLRGEGTYGGVYTWRDRAAMEDFTRTEMFAAVVNHPQLSGVRSTDFAVLDAPTAVTRGQASVHDATV
jgi:heme-degrading monooxygenase HmoA